MTDRLLRPAERIRAEVVELAILRNVYTFRFDPTRVQSLVERLPGVFEQARQELLSFAAFLEQQAQMGEDQS